MSLRRCIGQIFYKTFFIKPLLRNLFTKPFPRNLSHETFSTKPLCTELFCAELFCTKPSLEFPDTGVIRNFYYETIFGASVYRNYTKLLLRNHLYGTFIMTFRKWFRRIPQFLRNQKRFLSCAQVKNLFKFRRNPFFFRV